MSEENRGDRGKNGGIRMEAVGKKMFKTRRWAAALRVIFLAAVVSGSAFSGIYTARTIINGYDIEAQGTVYLDSFVHLDADYAFEPFANDDSGMQYVMVLTERDGEYSKYLLKMSEEDYESTGLKTLAIESYEYDVCPSAPLHMTGYVRQASDELRGVVGSAFAEYIGASEDEVYIDDFYIEPSGGGLIDKLTGNLGFESIFAGLCMLALGIFCIIDIVGTIRRQSRREAKLKVCRQLYDTDAEYAKGISEVNMEGTEYYRQCRLYITPNYVVSCKEGVEVFRIEDIRELYGYDRTEHNMAMFLIFGIFAGNRMHHCLAAVTADEELHIFADCIVVGRLHNNIVRSLIMKNSSMTLGRNNVPASELFGECADFKLTGVQGFYGNTDVWKGRVKESFISQV